MMDIDVAIKTLESLIDSNPAGSLKTLTPVVECLKQCAAVHVSARVLVDNASDGGNRPDYRVDVEDEHIDNLRELLAGQKIPDDPRYTALRLQVAASIRQIQNAVEGIDGTGTEKWLNTIIGNLNKKMGDRSAMETGTAIHKAILEPEE